MDSELKKEGVEILIATMNRSSLDFLIPMFPYCHFSEFSILVINQTSENEIINSEFPSVRVINSFEKGLSKSRNLAINNAVKKICLISDDDVIYFPNFENEIINAFEKNSSASIITFNHQRIGLDAPQNKSQKTYRHDIKSIWNVCSIEIAFRLDDIKDNNSYFDENFGLGSYFETAEEFLFLRKALRLKIKTIFYPFVIVSHPLLTSGQKEGEDGLLFARAALFYKRKGELAYLWVLKYLFFLYRNKFIKGNECVEKWNVALSAISKYKELKNHNNPQ